MVASRTVLVRIRADADQFQRELNTSSTSMRKLGDDTDRTGNKIDRFSGRLALIGQAAGALGPGLTPIIGASTQAVAGLATEFGFAVLAAGSAVIAFQGVGTALKALSDARIDPTAANLAKAEAAMEQLSPAGQDLARTISGLSDEWQRAKAIAQGGMFPGIEAGIDSLMTRLPELDQILATVSTTAGDLFAEGADSLASDRWTPLFEYLDTSAKPIMVETAHTAGSLAHAISSLIIAMDPLSRDFASGLADGADQLDRWATGLAGTEGFAEWMAYVQVTGPQVVDTVGSIASSIVSVLEAGSGAGTATLGILKGFADALSLIADSPVGPGLLQLVSTLSLLALGTKAWGAISTGAIAGFVKGQGQAAAALLTTTTAQQRATMSAGQLAAAQRGNLATLGKGAAGIAGLALSAATAGKGIEGANTASMALMGTMAGPWGAALGAGVGLLMDISQGAQNTEAAIAEVTATLDQQTGAITENTAAWVAKKFQDDGTFENAERAGLSLETVTRAALGQKDAVEELNAALAASIALDTEAGAKAAEEGSRDFTQLYESQTAGIKSVIGATEEQDSIIQQATKGMLTQKGVVDSVGGAYANAADQVDRFTNELAELNGWLDKRANWRAYQQSVDDFRKAINKSKGSLNEHNQEGRDAAASLDTLIANIGKVASDLQGSERQAYLTQARRDMRDALRQAGATKSKIQEVMAELRQLDGQSATVTIRTVRTGGMGPQDDIPGVATGGHIRGPGTRTSDSITARLSDYEYVVKAKAVEHYGVDFMDAVNSMRFAGGGLVTGDPRPSFPAGRTTTTVVTPAGYGDLVHLTQETNNRLRALETAISRSATETGHAVAKGLNNAAVDAWTGGAP